MMIIRGAKILWGDSFQDGADMRVGEGRILEIGPRLSAGSRERIVDAEGLFALPGLIDIHTHGLKSESIQDGSIVEYARMQLEQGVTCCVPTLYGSPEANRKRLMEAMRETDGLKRTPNVLGFRPEIMYVAKTGAGSANSLSCIDEEVSQGLYEAAEGKIPIWDVSPELDGAVSFVKWAVGRGIVASLAHTRASVDQARRTIDAGLSLVTHFYCTFDVAEPAEPGVYPSGLTDYLQIEDRVSVEIIPDGVHVHPLLVEKTLRCKGLERVIFVTDSLRGAGNPPGEYDGLAPGEKVAVTADRGIRRVRDNALSGSALTHLGSLRNAVRLFGRSMQEASVLCSRNAARLLRLRKGSLEVGMDADIILLSSGMELAATILAGSIAYSAL
jgi:N-acetylglucosamine-6-phosphate deacetylase